MPAAQAQCSQRETDLMIYRTFLSWRKLALSMVVAIVGLATGCSPTQPFYFLEDGDISSYVGMATNIEYPDTKTCSLQEVNDPRAPLTIRNPKFNELWEYSLAYAR